MALLKVYLDDLLITEKEINTDENNVELATLQAEVTRYEGTMSELSQTLNKIVNRVSDLNGVLDSVEETIYVP